MPSISIGGVCCTENLVVHPWKTPLQYQTMVMWYWDSEQTIQVISATFSIITHSSRLNIYFPPPQVSGCFIAISCFISSSAWIWWSTWEHMPIYHPSRPISQNAATIYPQLNSTEQPFLMPLGQEINQQETTKKKEWNNSWLVNEFAAILFVYADCTISLI